MAQRKLTFGLLDSRMFTEFDGEWRMQFNSRKVCGGTVVAIRRHTRCRLNTVRVQYTTAFCLFVFFSFLQWWAYRVVSVCVYACTCFKL